MAWLACGYRPGHNTIGGPAAGAGNVIAANLKEGMFIPANGNLVQGNFIGTNSLGTPSLGNGLSGVTLQNSASNRIIANVLSGNGTSTAGGVGLAIVGGAAQNNLAQGNLIGTDPTGTQAIPNSGGGLLLFGPAANNSIGGTSTGAGNVISGNAGDGIAAQNALNNYIAGNTIGTNAADAAGLGNVGSGINLQPSSGNTILNNRISDNDASGIAVQQSSGNNISGNLISANGVKSIAGDGIRIVGPSAGGNLVVGNQIGTDKTGTLPRSVTHTTVYFSRTGPRTTRSAERLRAPVI